MLKYTPLETFGIKTNRKENFYNIITYVLVTLVLLVGIILVYDILSEQTRSNKYGNALSLNYMHELLPNDLEDEPKPKDVNCRFDCLDIYRCGHNDRLKIYVYPLKEYVDSNGKVAATLTREFYKILETIVKSQYYSANPNQACLLVPSIDLLNGNMYDAKLVNRVLSSLDYWNNGGENHLLFNMLPGGIKNGSAALKTDKAIIMGGFFNSWTYRPGFDVALPQMVDMNVVYNLKSTKVCDKKFK